MDDMIGKTGIPAVSSASMADAVQSRWMVSGRRPLWLVYGLAIAATAATLCVHLVLSSAFADEQQQPLVILFIVPIILSAYVGGLGPGLASTLLGALGMIYFILPPAYSWQVDHPFDQVRWLTLILTGALVSILSQALHRSRQRAEAIVAERKQAEERLRAVVESAPQGVLMVDSSGSITLVNRELERAFGYAREELIGKSIEMLLPAAARGRHLAYRNSFIAQPEIRAMGVGRNLRGLRKDGGEIPVEVGLVPVRTREGSFVLATVMDISVRQRAEEATRRSQQLLQAVADNVTAIIWVKDLEGRYQLINGRYEEVFQMKREAIIGKTDYELLPQDQADIFRAVDRQALAAGTPVEAEEVVLHGDKPVTLLSVKSPLLDETGKPYALCGISTDITARKLDEETLAAERTLLRTLIDALPDVVFTKDTAGRFTLCNAAELKNVGFAHEEQLIGKTVFDLYPPEMAELYHADDLQTLRGQPVLNREEPSIDAAGNRRWYQTIKVPLRNRAGEIVGLVGASRDITNHKHAEESQRRSQKMEALGTLAGGIAHDFNNVLLAITGNTRLAAEELPAGHAAQESLAEIAKASTRASDLVQRILAFTRQQEIKRKVVHLQPVVEEALKLLRPTLPAMIRIETRFAANVPEVAADSSQIHQVIMNLATNSAHAIGQGTGLIEVNLDAPTVGTDLARASPDLREGRYARLSVSDNGCGIDKATLERIFDPFFTTKPAGQGTGLGLSTVHGIMRSHDGAVTVYSQPGKGTTFRLYFPAAGAAASEIEAPRGKAARGNGERVLYVDDESALVLLTSRILSRLGYTVVGHTDPVEALRAFRSDPQGFDVVVTDLSMPGMSGFDLAGRLLEIRPDAPIVMTSGYVRPEDQDKAAQIGIRALILKPNTVDELGHVLDNLFRNRQQAL